MSSKLPFDTHHLLVSEENLKKKKRIFLYYTKYMGNAATFWQSQLYVHVCQLYHTVYATIIIIVKWSVKIFQKNKGLDLHVLSPTKNTVNSLYTCTAEEINGTKLLVTFFLSLFLFLRFLFFFFTFHDTVTVWNFILHVYLSLGIYKCPLHYYWCPFIIHSSAFFHAPTLTRSKLYKWMNKTDINFM